MEHTSIGIVVSGGPAPGINSAIASIVIEASKRGYAPKGLQNGLRGAALGAPDSVVDLSIDAVTPYASFGGSILGTSRYNPFSKKDDQHRLLGVLERHRIDKLVTIGGDGSAYLSHQLSKVSKELKVVHLPKTIDNDLILPNNYPSFGFETACYAGTNILRILAIDAKTTNRWFVVTTMGRKSGSLALGIGMASAATLTLIPEEFEESTALEDVARIIFHTIKQRAGEGKCFGVALLAEGVVDKLQHASIPELMNCPRDEMGRIKYSEIPLEDLVVRALRKMLSQESIDMKLSAKNIGYELRCHDPISFDIEYTRFLGFGAVDYLLQGASGGMVVKDFDKLEFVNFDRMLDSNGRMQSRSVDLGSDLYRVARSYMIR